MINRISIFIDYDNFAIAYQNRFNKAEEDINIWPRLNDLLIDHYGNHVKNSEFEKLYHQETHLCVGFGEYIRHSEEKRRKEKFKMLDKENGFMVKF